MNKSHKIGIHTRDGYFEGFRHENVVFWDKSDKKTGLDIRCFVLIDKCVQLMNCPWNWDDGWYIDLIEIEYLENDEIRIIDLCIDIIVEGDGPTYRVIDLNDFAEGLINGRLDVYRLQEPLKSLQKFLDQHLHKNVDFPPSEIIDFM